MNNIKHLLCLLIIITIITTQSIYSSLQQYFTNATQDQLYVSIGLNEEATSAVLNLFRHWQSLYILKDKQQANSMYMDNPYTSIIFSKGEEQEGSGIKLSLGQICQRYYLKAPKLLFVTLRRDIIQFLESNNWTNNLCLPDLIMIQIQSDSKQIIDYLAKTGYNNSVKANNILYFSRKSISITIQQSQKSSTSYLSATTIKSIIQTMQQKGNIMTHFMKDQYLVINDFFNFSSIQQQNLLVFNFNPKNDFIVLGVDQAIRQIKNKSNDNVYKFEINKKQSLPQYLMFLPFKQKIQIRLMRDQRQTFCQAAPQTLIIESVIQRQRDNLEKKQKKLNIDETSKTDISISQYALTIFIILLLSYAIKQYIKNRRLDILKQKNNIIAYSQISKIQEFTEEQMQIQHH